MKNHLFKFFGVAVIAAIGFTALCLTACPIDSPPITIKEVPEVTKAGLYRKAPNDIKGNDTPLVSFNKDNANECYQEMIYTVNTGRGVYTLCLDGDVSVIEGSRLNPGNRVLYLIGLGDEERTISITDTGSLFTIGEGASLILGKNITLKGFNENLSSLVQINGGELRMKTGSVITGNAGALSTRWLSGGGVTVNSGTFTMEGGEISGNTAGVGSGVYVNGPDSKFTMVNGSIKNNTSYGKSVDTVIGGGVFIYNGTFEMKGGEIKGNHGYIDDPEYGFVDEGNGGGVAVISDIDGPGAVFTMTGGSIKENICGYDSAGGGVYLRCSYSSGKISFTMTGGEISDNEVRDNSGAGGGVFIYGKNITFTMTGGKIKGNKVGEYGIGGGVYIDEGNFTMYDGEISGNTAGGGGGIYAGGNGVRVYMYDGKISGNTATSNDAWYSGGGGVYCDIYGSYGFFMSGGEISGNTTAGNGGGVIVEYGYISISDGVKISNNTASGSGGGVYVANGTLDMSGGESGGEISGNKATANGGGVCVAAGEFEISTGIIYGSNATDASLKNTAGGAGAALWVNSDPSVKAYRTWPEVDLDKIINNTIKVFWGELVE